MITRTNPRGRPPLIPPRIGERSHLDQALAICQRADQRSSDRATNPDSSPTHPSEAHPMQPGWTASACLLLALTTAPSFGQKPDSPHTIHDQQEYQQAYELGASEADRELKNGVATIYVCGLRSFFENLDHATGLPYAQFGCVVTDEVRGRIAGHNSRINESIRQSGPPANSFQRWEKELFDLEGYCAKSLATTLPHPLTPGGPPLISPDGGCTIHPVQTSVTKDDGTRVARLGLAIHLDGLDRAMAKILMDDGTSDLIWGPPGSHFAIIRSHRDDKTILEALDLNRARSLRIEF